ncbi:YolD-like family protein [Brevibacillus centrosporus]|uniref:YolD-like family protein n=1 Tax=Brevibacillus centrosporus TaxID=54910 RepID=UPI002E2008A2|nr:YolD-like family protein [Brevibacillus centrosporus]
MASRLENPFITSFILPEHATALYEHQYNKKLDKRPHIDEDDLAAMSEIFYDSINQDMAIVVSWFKPYKGELGKILTEWGVAKYHDIQLRQVKLVRTDGIWWIPIDQLVRVEPLNGQPYDK